jgi:hypothetical protein
MGTSLLDEKKNDIPRQRRPRIVPLSEMNNNFLRPIRSIKTIETTVKIAFVRATVSDNQIATIMENTIH